MAEDKRSGQVTAVGYHLKPDGSIVFQEGTSELERQAVIADRKRMMAYEAKRRELWEEIGPESMTRLARMFPSLSTASGVEPWDAIQLLEWLCGPAPTSGSTWAALFCLGVWHDLDWSEAAKEDLPPRQCPTCTGLGRVGRKDGESVRKGDAPGTYVRPRYDDDDNVVSVDEVATEPCRRCEGKGEYQPSLEHGRFNVFRALSLWDREHAAAFRVWTE